MLIKIRTFVVKSYNNMIDITPKNDKGQNHGYWELYFRNGNIWYKGFFHNGIRIGYEEWYTSNTNNLIKSFHIR